MTDEQDTFEAFKKAITESVEARLATGGKIVAGAFSSEDWSLCPIACCVGVVQPDYELETNEATYASRLTIKLGVPMEDNDVWDFIDGFDDIRIWSGEPGRRFVNIDSQYYQFGQELRSKIPNLVQA